MARNRMSPTPVECPRIVSTDLNGLRLLTAFDTDVKIIFVRRSRLVRGSVR
jgi:hypothetical protein